MSARKDTPVILLSREGDRWRAEVPDLVPGWQSEPEHVLSAVAAARQAVATPKGSDLKVKVAEGAKLERNDVLALIEANGGPRGLDLSECHIEVIDLSREAVQREGKAYFSKTGAIPPFGPLSVHDGLNLVSARLEGAQFTGSWYEASFDYAHLEGARFSGARLQGAHFLETHLEGADLRRAELQGLYLYDVASLAGAYWCGAVMDRTRIRRDKLGEAIGDEVLANKRNTASVYREAREAYLLLKNNFNSIGRYQDAAWAHVREQRMEKAALWRDLSWRQFPRPAFWRACIPWALSWAMDALTGYGETPQKPLGVAVVLATLFFPLLFWAVGALPDHGRAFTSTSPSDIDWAGWGDSVVFSLTNFGTLTFSDLEPDGTLPTVLAALQAFSGVLLSALFIFTLAHRMSRS